MKHFYLYVDATKTVDVVWANVIIRGDTVPKLFPSIIHDEQDRQAARNLGLTKFGIYGTAVLIPLKLTEDNKLTTDKPISVAQAILTSGELAKEIAWVSKQHVLRLASDIGLNIEDYSVEAEQQEDNYTILMSDTNFSNLWEVPVARKKFIAPIAVTNNFFTVFDHNLLDVANALVDEQKQRIENMRDFRELKQRVEMKEFRLII